MSLSDHLISRSLPITSESYIYPRVIDWRNLIPTNKDSLKVGSNIEFSLELDFIQEGGNSDDDELIKSFPEEEIAILVTLEKLPAYKYLETDEVLITSKKYSSTFQQVAVSELEIDGRERRVASKVIPITMNIPMEVENVLDRDSILSLNCKIMIGENEKIVDTFPINITSMYKKKKKPMLGFDMLYCTNKDSSGSDFSYPLDVTLYHERNVYYVTDTYNRRIAVFDLTTREFKFHISPNGYPRCLAVSQVDDSIIFTCDDNYVYKYSYDGSKLIWKSYPNLNWPRGLVIDPTNEDIYICDFGGHKIQVINKHGDILRSFGSHGRRDDQFDGPKDIDFDLDGNLIVSDRENHRILILCKYDGSVIKKLENGMGKQPGQFNSQEGFCVDRTNGNIIVCDSMNDRIQIFNSNLEFITSFGEAGIEKSELTKPTGCALDEKRQELLVVEWNNQRMQIFRYPLLSKNAKLTKTKLLKNLLGGILSDIQIKIEMD